MPTRPKPALTALPFSPSIHWKPSLGSYDFSFFPSRRKAFSANFRVPNLEVVFGTANEIRASSTPYLFDSLPLRERERFAEEFFRIHRRVFERLAFDAGLPVTHSLLSTPMIGRKWRPFAKQHGYEFKSEKVEGFGFFRKTFQPVNHVLSGREAKLFQLYREKLLDSEPVTEIKLGGGKSARVEQITATQPRREPIEIKITKDSGVRRLENALFSPHNDIYRDGVYAYKFVNAGYLRLRRKAQHPELIKAVKRALRGGIAPASIRMRELAKQKKFLNPEIPVERKQEIVRLIAPFVVGAQFYVEKDGTLVFRKLLTSLD